MLHLTVFLDFSYSCQTKLGTQKNFTDKNASIAAKVIYNKENKVGAVCVGTTKYTLWPPGGIVD